MTSPLLEGLRVIDLTNVLAGPYAGYQLALFGAEVLKVETPHGGDLARRLGADSGLAAEDLGVSFLAQNANKRSITLDLKDDDDRSVFSELVTTYDVVLENFRPGVMDRFGFGWNELKRLNPSVIYCAVSGFGQTGPMRDRPAYDQIIQGLSGLMSVTGTPDTAPIRVGAPICDSIGGLVAAFAVASAAVRRERTGTGAMLDVSMLEAAITTMGWVVSDQLIAGREPIAMANENRTSAPSGTFETANGKLNIAANKQEQYEALCACLDRPDLLDDERFRTRDLRKVNRVELKIELERTLRTKSAAEWDAMLLGTSIPAAPVVSVRQALNSAQIQERSLITALPSPSGRGGEVHLLGSPVHVDGAPVAPTTAPPALGADNAAVLGELAERRRRSATGDANREAGVAS